MNHRTVTESELAALFAADVFDSISEGITITDAKGAIILVNSAFSAITGYSAEEAIGKNPRMLKSQHHDADFYRHMWESLKGQGVWQGEILNRRKGGTVYPEWLSISSVRDSLGTATNYVAVFSDRSDMKEREDRINRLKNHDILTDLPNRFLFLDRVGEAIRMAERERESLAVLYFDFEKFKYINSQWGYPAGDAILQGAGKRIQETLRKADTVARIGGDEFAVLLPNVDKAENALRTAKAVIKALERPYQAKGEELFLKAAGGIALWPGDGATPDELVANATIAAKGPRRNEPENPHLYAAGIGEQIRSRLDLEAKLRRAIENENFELHYQPRVRTEDGSIAGMEALVRWRNEEGALVPPSAFIPLAEETGLIVPLGEWVLREALRAARAWREQGNDIVVSVNLSARQFKDGQVEKMILRALGDTDYPPSALELELTESVAMRNIELTIGVMSALAEGGIRFSLDDFGTGYSSFYYLRKLPIEWLKIDQSFVKEIGPSSKTENAIIKAIISMAKSLGLGTIAEGCETPQQYHYLRELGCDQIQGFLFSKPLPEPGFSALLRHAPLPLPEG